MNACRGCGAETVRTSARYREGELLSEVCPQCSPETFQGEKLTDPSDRRIWEGHEAEPERYYAADAENVVRAKDELRQDVWDQFNRDPDEEAREAKRKRARREPMRPQEIQAAENYVREVVRPALETAQLNRQYQHTE